MSTFQRAWWRTAGRWAGRALRVSVGLAAVAGCAGLVAVRVSYARAAEAGLNFSEELHQLTEQHLSGDVDGESYEIAMNGQPFEASAAGTGRSMAEVLDYFQEQCKTNGDGLGERLSHLSTTLHDLPPAKNGHPGFMVVRKEAEDRSFVFCLGENHELSTPEMLHRMQIFAKTGDLGRIGDLRYITVFKDQGGSMVTSVSCGEFPAGKLHFERSKCFTCTHRQQPVRSKKIESGACRFGLCAGR